jgi:2-oxoglutarate ferredoxin oxidoreductase subunit delta
MRVYPEKNTPKKYLQPLIRCCALILYVPLFMDYSYRLSRTCILIKGGFMPRKGTVVIDREVCKGCFLCIHFCPMQVLEEDTQPNTTGSYPSKATHRENCIACGNCFEVCPDLCITVYALTGAEI